MRVQSVSFNNYTGLNQKNKLQKKNQSNPQFEGRELTYKASYSGSTGIGPSCEIYENNNLVASYRVGMYESVNRAIESAVFKAHPVGYKAKIENAEGSGTNKIYFADPDETINGDMRKKYAYIVYDAMPEMPSLKELHHKFHSLNGNDTDYNQILKDVTEFHKRMLKADLKKRSEYELKKIEDEDTLKNSLKARDNYYFQYEKRPYDQRLVNDLNNASFFVSVNEKNLQEDNDKYDYYTWKNEGTRKKIEFTKTLEEILDKAGGILIERDILSKNYLKDKEIYEYSILHQIDNEHLIKNKNLEKNMLTAQLEILDEKQENLKKQKFDGNASSYELWNRTGSSYCAGYKEERNKLLEEIKQLKLDLDNLNAKKLEIQSGLNEYKNIINVDIKKIQAQIAKAEPIYQELKAYYEANNPF